MTLDGQPVTTPASVTSVVGMIRTLGVITPQAQNGTSYSFTSWPDSGAATHNITTASANTTYTATFGVVSQIPLSASYSSAAPANWLSSETKNYMISITNTGSQTWNARGTQIVRLGVHFGTASDWPNDGWATDQRFYLPYDVAPGRTVTMNVAVTAPTTAGSYVLRHRMVKENVAWFFQIQKTNVNVITPDTTPPTVNTITPGKDATGVLTTAVVSVSFSEAMDPSTINTTNLTLLKQGAAALVPATVSYDATNKSATLKPNSYLATNAVYIATIKGGAGGVKDAAGNPLAVDTTWSFTTTATPANSAAFIAQTVPTTMQVGRNYTVSITMKNTGTKDWTPQEAYKLGSWNPRDTTTWGVTRSNITITVAPGGQYTFTFTVTAPAAAGKYNFQWKMLQELTAWFDVATTNILIDVN